MSVHLGISVLKVRLAMVLMTLVLGAGPLLYLWLWMTVPLDNQTRLSDGRLGVQLQQVTPGRSGQIFRNQMLVAGIGLVIIAVTIAVLQHWFDKQMPLMIAIGLVVFGLILAWTQVPNIASWRSPKVVAFIGAGLSMVVAGLVLLLGRNDPGAALLRGVLIGAVVLLGVLVALIPLWLGLVNDLSKSKIHAAKEAERADIAAHLHDSVLQTLTLIRMNAQDANQVRSLALQQERQLRAWLYTGQESRSHSIAQELKEEIGEVESRYGVPIEVVVVGDLPPTPESLALVAATKEAATNAVRHGAPPVSVYLEAREETLEIFVKDAGEGFDLETIDPDRHGVKDSIIARVRRVGGEVSIRRLNRGGTEVSLVLPRNLKTAAPSGKKEQK